MVDFTKLFEKEVEQDQALKDYIAKLPVNAVDSETGFTNYTNPVIPELKLPVQGVHPTYIPTQRDIKGPIQFLPAVQQGNENVSHIIKEGADFNRLLGTNGAERAQTWPEKMVRSGYTLPTDVMEGRVLTGVGLRPGDYSDDPNAPHPLAELIERGQDLAGMAAGGSIASTGLKAEAPGALSRLASRLKERLNEESKGPTGINVKNKEFGPAISSEGETAIQSFMDGDKKNAWIDVPEGQMYLRQSRKPRIGNTLDISNLNFENKGTGAFTNYLNHIEDQVKNNKKYDGVFVENIFNDRLIPFLEKRGYVKYDSSDPPSMVMPKSRLELLQRSTNLTEDSEAGTALSATKNSFANRLNEHINEGQMSMPEILAKQRASEGYEAAIRDPETKKLYTGMWHEEVLDKLAKDKGIPKDQLPSNLRKGYVDFDGKFWTEQQLENKSRSKTAMFRSDDLAGTAVAGAANSMAPKFYSALERSVSNSKSNKASPEQWLGLRTERTYTDKNTGKEVHEVKYSGMLGNTPGITVEEIEHLRLPEWIDAQKQSGKKSISKKEIQNYINENKVEMNEKWGQNILDFEIQTVKLADKAKQLEAAGDIKGAEAIRKQIKDNADVSAFKPRFAQYQLAGWNNYRELLLNLKDNPAKVKRIEEVKNRVEQINNEISDIQKQLRNPGDWKINNYEEMKQKSNEFKERQANLATERFKIEHELTSNDFEHSHWPGEKNTLVHSRMNDRFIPDEGGPSVKDNGEYNRNNLSPETYKKLFGEGEKGLNSLHIEEIQSDLHQQGNSEGYKLPADLKKKLEPEFNRIEEKIITTTEDARKKVVDAFKSKKDQTEITKLQTEALELEKSIVGNPDLNDAIKNAIARKVITLEEGRIYKRYSDSERQGAVMDAPFKDKWSDVMIKRLIRQAAEENKDSISWTPGQAQVDRYPGLEKHLSEVHYNKTKSILTGYDKDGKVVVVENNVLPDKLTGMIGKEPADKLLKNKEELKSEKSLKDLKIRSANDGGGGYEIVNDEGTVIHHTPTRKSAEQWVNWKGKQNDVNPKHETYRIKGEDLKIGGEFHKKFYDEIMVNKVNAIAKKFGGRVEEISLSHSKHVPAVRYDENGIPQRIPQTQKIWVLRLTPELKKHALEKGFSMFESGLPIVPVDHDPFQTKKHKLIPVSHNPFE